MSGWCSVSQPTDVLHSSRQPQLECRDMRGHALMSFFLRQEQTHPSKRPITHVLRKCTKGRNSKLLLTSNFGPSQIASRCGVFTPARAEREHSTKDATVERQHWDACCFQRKTKSKTNMMKKRRASLGKYTIVTLV